MKCRDPEGLLRLQALTRNFLSQVKSGKESTEAKRNTHEAQPSGYSSEPRWIPADLAAELEEYRGNSEADGPKNGAQRRH